ncbi:MAG: RNA polymerase sigma factor region1.1 domain-containing protein, partial [Ghiorsea sp.]|nr:RNA polymerase sigma factor region1.1 domain-containing protein [Ghiorsea sp.]
MSKKEQAKVKELGTLMAKGKEAGYITYDELNSHFPKGLV